MQIAQGAFGLIVILIALTGRALGVGSACWLVLVAVRRRPLIDRRSRHRDWDVRNQWPRTAQSSGS